MPKANELDLLPSHVCVLRALHEARTATRVELSATTKLSSQSLTRITKQLIDYGLVREGDRLMGGRGQPAIRLFIPPNSLVSIGLVLEHDRITCSARGIGGEELVRLRRWGDFNSPDAAVAQSLEILRLAMDQLPESATLTGIGVSQSGFFHQSGSHALVSRNDPASWREFDVRSALEDSLGVGVFLENDASAAAVGLSVQGIGSRYGSFYSILMVKGVAGGFVSDGHLLRGHLGNAGEMGILFGTGRDEREFRPCEESLYKFLRQRWGATPTPDQVETGFADGDRDIQEWIAGAVETLSPALNAVVALLDPEAIIFTGRLPACLRKAISEACDLQHPQYGGFSAPPPPIIVDPSLECLEVGASSLPLFEFLNSDRR